MSKVETIRLAFLNTMPPFILPYDWYAVCCQFIEDHKTDLTEREREYLQAELDDLLDICEKRFERRLRTCK